MWGRWTWIRGGPGRIMLALAGLVALLVIGVPDALGATTWYEIGSAPSPINHDALSDGNNPLLALVGTTPSLAWNEADTISGTAVGQARVASLTGTPVDPRPWTELSAASSDPNAPGSLNLDPTHPARDIHIANISGVPYAAWIENDGSADQIHVARWNGTQWVLVGGTVNPGTAGTEPHDVSIAGFNGAPYVAWTRGPNQLLDVKRYNGTSWVDAGTLLNFYPGGLVHNPQLATDGTTLYVAWAEECDSSHNTRVWLSRYAGGTSTAWTRYTDSASGAACVSISGPRLAVLNGRPFVAFAQPDSNALGATRVFVEAPSDPANASGNWNDVPYRDTGSTAVQPSNTDGVMSQPSLTVIGSGTTAALYLAWAEVSPSTSPGTQHLIYVDKLTTQDGNLPPTTSLVNGEWDPVGTTPLNHDDTKDAVTPAIIDRGGGIPLVAWTERDGAGHAQIRTASFGEVPKSTGRPQITGTPKTGSQLTCTHGSWDDSPTGFTVLWERGLRGATTDSDPSWHAIGGASGDHYTVQAADEGSRVRCRVIASTATGTGEAVSTSVRTDAGLPFLDAPGYPRVEGGPRSDAVLTCNPGPTYAPPGSGTPGQPGWHNYPSFTYQWTRNGQPIPGATSQTYFAFHYRAGPNVVNSTGDGDHLIGCTATASNDIGTAPPVNSAAIHLLDSEPFNTVAPSIQVIQADPAQPNPLTEKLQCAPGSWVEDDRQYSYQWLREGAPLTGATTNEYLPGVNDLGRHISCEVTDTNLLGSNTAASTRVLVPLPQGVNDVDFHREGPNNPVDPTNLLAITGRYEQATRDLTYTKLQQGIGTATSACRDEAKSHPNWPDTAPTYEQSHNPLTEEDRCRILLHDASQVHVITPPAVVWCTARSKCRDMSIQVAPVDPLKPPPQDATTLASLAPSTPRAIIWDIDHNGVADAVCTGSAPVMRTILGGGRWHPQVIIIDGDGTIHRGDLRFSPNPNAISGGRLRPGQVKVCGTSLDPPPSPQLPCVTGGDIGPIHISDANLCPINARNINDADFEQLLDGDLKQYLLRVSEAQLANSGEATTARARPDGGQAKPVYASFAGATGPDTMIPTRHTIRAAPDAALRVCGTCAFGAHDVEAALANTAATISSENTPAGYDKLIIAPWIKDAARTDFLKFAYNADNAPLAYDQIYVARGIPSGQGSAADNPSIPGASYAGGQMLVNGVGMAAVPDHLTGKPTALLLAPSDINGALPNVHSMTAIGRETAVAMGLPSDPSSVPLAVKGRLDQELKDQASAAAQQALADTNLKQMLDQAQSEGTAQGNALLNRLQDSLHLGPFHLTGNAHVDINNDGTATLTVGATLPSLTSAPAPPPGNDPDAKPPNTDLVGEATIHADLQGHLALRGIHVTAQNAFLGGIQLSGVDLKYDSTTGFDIKAQIIIPALDGQGLNIKNFALGPKGQFRDLNIDYLSGPGGGIPLGYGLFITTLGADINVAADEFAAHAVVSVGSSTGKGCPTFGADATLQVKFASPFAIDGNIDALISCLKLGNVHLHIDQTGLISLTGKWGLDAGPLYFNVNVGAAFDHGNFQVYGRGDGGIRGVLTGAVEAVLSNRALAGCGSVDVDIPIVDGLIKLITGHKTIHLAGGAAVEFKDGPPLSAVQILANLKLFTGCDIGGYYTLGRPNFARGAAAGSSSFRLAPKLGPTLISLEGTNRAPRVILHSPSGQTFDFSHATGNTGQRLATGQWGTVLDSENRTVVILPNAQGGVWTADVVAGSVPIVRIERAVILPPPALRATVTGKSTKRALRYTVVKEPGQTVQFYEQATGELKRLATTRGGSKTVRYTVGEARSTHRQLVALVFQNGMVRKRLIVARYSASNPKVGRVGRLRVRRSGSRAVITWRRAALGQFYFVRVVRGTGLRLLFAPRHGSTRVTVTGLRRGEGLRVTVRAESPAGRFGPVATTTLKGSFLVGSRKLTPRFKPAPLRKVKPKKKHHPAKKHK